MKSRFFLYVLSMLSALVVTAFGAPNTNSIKRFSFSPTNPAISSHVRSDEPEGVVADAPVDFNGDGRTDWAVIRNSGGIYSWFIATNGGSPQPVVNWGITSDRLINGDFDGDLRDDIAVFRPSNSTFYILLSQSSTLRIENFGQTGDDPTVVGDYNNDGRDDIAVYREGNPSTWFYKTSPPASLFVARNWGQVGDFPAPGDYDGDGRYDFAIQRPTGGSGVFWIFRSNDNGITVQAFGGPNDLVVPGDYDGDRRTDLAVAASSGGVFVWSYKPSNSPAVASVSRAWGLTSDLTTQGDYDGDGRVDFAVWRPSTGVFWVSTTGTGSIITQTWGVSGDLPVARFNAH